MSEYCPDRWVVLEFTDLETGEKVEKVFSGNYGGYCGSDTWKLNSGNVSHAEFEDRFEFVGYSGSTYVCYKNRYGMSGYMLSMLDYWNSMSEQSNCSIKILHDFDKA